MEVCRAGRCILAVAGCRRIRARTRRTARRSTRPTAPTATRRPRRASRRRAPRPAAADARSHPHDHDLRPHAGAGDRAERRRAEGRGRVPDRPPRGAARAAGGREPLQRVAGGHQPATGPSWNGWGNGVNNARYAKTGGLTAADLPRLKLKWAFGYAGVDSARAQPALAGGRLFVASENAEIHALDPKTGCTHWTVRARMGVRTALSVGPYRTPGASGYAVFFGDGRANVYALDANTGRELWVRKVDDHRFAAITGAPTYHNGRLYVGVQGLNEEGQGGRAAVRVLHLPRQRVGARRQHRRGAVEALHDRRAEAAREEQGRRAAVGPGGRRHLVGAHGGSQAQHDLRGHRQQLRRAVAEDHRRGDGAGHGERHGEVGESGDAERQLDHRLPRRRTPTTRTARRRSAPTSTSPPRRRWSPSTARTCWCCRRSRACPTRSIRIARARWCGATASVRAAAWAASGAARPTRRTPTSACRTS